MTMATVAIIGGVAALGGAVIQADAASSAAQTQADALRSSQGIQQGMYQQQLTAEHPFVEAGQEAQGNLNQLLGVGKDNGQGGFGSLNQKFDANTFKSMSPAYQFGLQQGGQGVLNQDSSSQGAESGAALKDLMSFNQGYANNSFQNAFNQYQTQNSNIFNRLYSVAGLGESAASNQATGGSAYASGIGQTAGAIGGAQAAGQIGVGNAIAGGLQGASNNYTMSQALPWLMANQQGGLSNSGPMTLGDFYGQQH